jgi:hypothetical protein
VIDGESDPMRPLLWNEEPRNVHDYKAKRRRYGDNEEEDDDEDVKLFKRVRLVQKKKGTNASKSYMEMYLPREAAAEVVLEVVVDSSVIELMKRSWRHSRQYSCRHGALTTSVNFLFS